MERKFLFFTPVKRIFNRNLKMTFSVLFGISMVCSVHASYDLPNAKISENIKKIGSVPLQQTTVSGTILDDTGAPLPGASIVVKGTTTGVTSDFDGNFVINLPDGKNILVVSYVGFKSQEVDVTGKTKINISLVTDASALDEIVVVGYATQKKSTLTGSVSTMKGEEIAKIPAGNDMPKCC